MPLFPSFTYNSSTAIVLCHLKLKARMALVGWSQAKAKSCMKLSVSPSLTTVLSLSFCIVNAWPFKHFIAVYRRLAKIDNQQHYHIGFTWVAYRTESSAVRALGRVLTFILSVSAKSWHCKVCLIVIYFHSTPPRDHLVINLFIYAASPMRFVRFVYLSP